MLIINLTPVWRRMTISTIPGKMIFGFLIRMTLIAIQEPGMVERIWDPGISRMTVGADPGIMRCRALFLVTVCTVWKQVVIKYEIIPGKNLVTGATGIAIM